MRAMSIRPARADDMVDVTAIYRPAVVDGTASFELEPPDVAEMTRRWRAVVDAGFPYIVAQLDDRVVGYAYFSSFRPRPAYRFSVENSVYVAQDLHRSGVGRRLVAELIHLATNAGYRQMVAIVGDGPTNSGSIALHEALGFTKSGTVRSVGWKHGRWLDITLLQLALGDGNTAPPA